MKPNFYSRSSGTELMDDLACSGEVVDQTLRELEFINRTLGGNHVTVQGVLALIDKQAVIPITILDLGCGGGDMLLLLQRKLEKVKVSATFIGIDANPNIVQYAAGHCQGTTSISFAALDILSPTFQQCRGDIAMATLFFHHFTADQLVAILRGLYNQVRLGIVINDLHRHPLAYYAIKLLTTCFSKSAMVKYDAPLSVLRGFSKKELIRILDWAGITQYTIQWKWAFRWQVVVWKK